MSIPGPINPYATPAAVPEPENRAPAGLTREQARTRLLGPAVGILMTAVVSLGVLLMMLLAVIMDVVRGNPVPQGMVVFLVLHFVGGILSHLVQLAGAIAMLRVRGRTWAILAVAASFNPCNFYCCWIPLPFAVWGAVVLADPAARAAFVRE